MSIRRNKGQGEADLWALSCGLTRAESDGTLLYSNGPMNSDETLYTFRSYMKVC